MITSTVTVSSPKKNCNSIDGPIVLVLENESEDLTPVQGLMQSMRSSGALSTLPKEKLEEVALGYASLSDPTPRQQSILLHQLIHDVIQPSTQEELEDEQMDALFDFEDQAKILLKQILPKGTAIQDYLKQLSIEKVVIERLILYRNFYQSQLDILNQSAESVNFKMIAKFEEIRGQFLKFSADIEGVDESLNRRIEEVSKKMQFLGKRYEEVKFKAHCAVKNFTGLQNNIKESFT